jgi:hypothetical protein
VQTPPFAAGYCQIKDNVGLSHLAPTTKEFSSIDPPKGHVISHYDNSISIQVD